MTQYKDIHCASGRITVRTISRRDFDAVVLGYALSGEALNRFDEGRVDVARLTEEWYREELEQRCTDAERDDCYMFNIFRNSDGVCLGYCDITVMKRDDFQFAKVGYTIFNQYWGNGYGTESLCALTEIGFRDLELHRLEAHVNMDNPASKRVLEKAGYSFECVRRRFILEDGVWTDHEVWYRNAD